MERKYRKTHRDAPRSAEVLWDGPRPVQQAVAADLSWMCLATRLSGSETVPNLRYPATLAMSQSCKRATTSIRILSLQAVNPT